MSSTSNPTANPPARGDATREAIVRSAMQVFGEAGFHAASTRSIAQAAGANQALIGYHFGGKEGLYLTVFEHIAGRVQTLMGPLIEAVEVELDAERGSGPSAAAEHIDRVVRLVNGFAAMLTQEETTPWARLILREQQAPSPAFDLLYERVLGRVIRLLGRLVARAAGRLEPGQGDRITALTLVGQALVFRAARAAVLRSLGWEDFGEAEVAALQRQLTVNVTAVLQAARPGDGS